MTCVTIICPVSVMSCIMGPGHQTVIDADFLGTPSEMPEFLKDLRDRAVNDPIFASVFQDIPDVLEIVKDPLAYAKSLDAGQNTALHA